MKPRAAFSLVELLVVIAIVALLVALLLPSMGKARDASRMVACQSQLRQISVALSMYRGDWKGHFPLMYQVSDGTDFVFAHRLRPYLSVRSLNTTTVGRHVFYCPSATLYTSADNPTGANPDGQLRTDAWIYSQVIATYSMTSGLGYNASFYDQTAPSSAWLCQKRELYFPSKTLIYADGYDIPRNDHSFQRVKYRHTDGGNLLMGDMSVGYDKRDVVANLLTSVPVFTLRCASTAASNPFAR